MLKADILCTPKSVICSVSRARASQPLALLSLCAIVPLLFTGMDYTAIIVRADSSPDNGHGSVLLDPIGILASDKLHYALHRSYISATKSEVRNRSIIDYCGN